MQKRESLQGYTHTSLRIRYNLFKAKRKHSAPRAFKRELWKQLSQNWDERSLPRFSWYQQPVARWSAAALLGLVIVGSIGTGAYAYTSSEVAEGSPLYPVKLKLEALAERVHLGPEKKAKFYLKKIERREAERRALERRREKALKTEKIEKIERQVEYIEEKLEKVEARFSEKTPPVLKQKVRERLERRKARLEKRTERMGDK